MKHSRFSLILIWPLLFMGFSLWAQTDKDLLLDLMEEEQQALNALVLYPEETRMVIFESAMYPEALIKFDAIQEQTSRNFRLLLENFDRSTQQMIWDLSRYPGLIRAIVVSEARSRGRVNDILVDYPEVIHKRAHKAAKNHPQLLKKVNRLNESAETAFEAILYEYSPALQETFRELIALPEVLTILTENIRLTILVGDLYYKEPEWVMKKTADMQLELAQSNARELEDWQKSLEENPTLRTDLEAATREYRDSYGYDDVYYSEGDDEDVYYVPKKKKVVVHHYYYHYPYWLGYPYWYVYPRWRPFPMWYDWGFYWGPRGGFYVINLPSFYFMNWYFYHPYHHYYWPNLSTHFVRHSRRYTVRHRSASSIGSQVRAWQASNRQVINDDWLRTDGELPRRFEEFGRSEIAREKYNLNHPNKQLNQREYVERHPRRYPDLNKSSKEASVKRETTSPYPVWKNTDTKNREIRYPRKVDQPQRTTRSKDKVVPTPQKTVRPKATPSKREFPKVNRGKDLHRNNWQKATKPKARPSSSPAVRSMPKAKPAARPSRKNVKSRGQ